MKNYKLIFLFFLITLFSSCSHYYYAPDEANVMKLAEQNDLKISASGNSTNGNYEIKHANFQISYSPIKHLGVFASRFNLKGKEPINSPERGGNGFLNNAAMGGYYFFETGSILDRIIKYDEELAVPSGFLLDAYLGYGKGHVHNFYIEGGTSDLDLQKYFIQGGIHWQGKTLGASYVLKFGKINFFNGLIEGQIDDENINSIRNIETIREFPFRETSLKFYMGIRHARVYLNVSTVVDVFDNNFLHRTSLGSFGIIMDIDDIYRSIRNK